MKLRKRLLILLSVAAPMVWMGCEADPSVKRLPKPPIDKITQPQDFDFTSDIDILFVIDDSFSMDTHQNNLRANFSKFSSAFVNAKFLNYHLGVTSSGDGYNGGSNPRTERGRLMNDRGVNFVDRNTPDGENIINDYLLVGVAGSGYEKFFDPVQWALTAPLVNNENKGFYRQDAFLAVIFVTDAPDQSENIRGAKEFYDFLVNLKGGHGDRVMAYGAIIPSAVSGCNRDPGGLPVKLERFFSFFGYQPLNLCDQNFGDRLGEVGKDLVKRATTIYLNRVPNVATIEVTYGSQVVPQDVHTGWSYDPSRNVLYLGQDLKLKQEPPGTQIQVYFDAL